MAGAAALSLPILYYISSTSGDTIPVYNNVLINSFVSLTGLCLGVVFDGAKEKVLEINKEAYGRFGEGLGAIIIFDDS